MDDADRRVTEAARRWVLTNDLTLSTIPTLAGVLMTAVQDEPYYRGRGSDKRALVVSVVRALAQDIDDEVTRGPVLFVVDHVLPTVVDGFVDLARLGFKGSARLCCWPRRRARIEEDT